MRFRWQISLRITSERTEKQPSLDREFPGRRLIRLNRCSLDDVGVGVAEGANVIKGITEVALNYFVKEPDVDIIIINWNYGRFVGDAIQSVKDQSYQKYRCIVVDNGSDDDSLDRITEAIGGHPQFGLFRLPSNLGHLGAALWSLEHCSAEFVTFLDADDVLFPAYLESHLQAHLAAVSPVGFTCSNCVDMSANGALLSGGNSRTFHYLRGRGEPALLPIERAIRLTGIDDQTYEVLVEATRYLPAQTPSWFWWPGSSTCSAESYWTESDLRNPRRPYSAAWMDFICRSCML